MVSCTKFAFLMTIYASYALLLAQAEDLRRLKYDSDQVEDITRSQIDDFEITRDIDDYNERSSSDIGDERRLNDRFGQTRRMIASWEEEERREERRSMSGPTLPQSERLADDRSESTRYGSIERSVDRQVERLEDREDRVRSTDDSERLSADRHVEREENREDRTRSTVDSERLSVDREVERLEDLKIEDRTRSTVGSDRRDGVFDRRESRRESGEETSERRVTSRREYRGEFERESREVSRREARREDRSENRSEDRESRFEQDSERQTRTRIDEDNVRAERSSRRSSTDRAENEGQQSDRMVRRENVRDFRSTESNVALVESNSQITTFLGQMVSLIVTVMLVNKSTKGGFTSKVKQLFSNKVTVQ